MLFRSSDLFERWPGSEYGDHARGNLEMQAELTRIFAGRTTAEWVQFGIDVDVPIAPVNTPQSMQHDPQFAARFSWIPKERLGADQLPFPVVVEGQEPLVPTKAPTVGEHTDAVLADVLGLDAAAIAALRERGALG